MIRSGLRRFRRAPHLTEFLDRIGQEIADEKQHRQGCENTQKPVVTQGRHQANG